MILVVSCAITGRNGEQLQCISRMLNCTIVGELHVYHVTEAPKTTVEEFRNRLYGEHHQVYKFDNIDTIVCNIQLPSEIHSKVGGLRFFCNWKASECASFLNYIGISPLKRFVDEKKEAI